MRHTAGKVPATAATNGRSRAANSCTRWKTVFVNLDAAALIERLTAQGVISAPVSSDRPRATGQQLPRPHSPLSELVSELRR